MAQFTIYQSTDSSAPVLSGTSGSLISLLDAVLVNGYGSKAAAGWTKAFSGTNKAVYKTTVGITMYYRFLDDASGIGGAKESKLYPYETMSDVDTGTGWISSTGSYHVVRKSNTADSTARAWIIFADARTAYVHILAGDGPGIYTSFQIGEFYSFVNNDSYRHCVQPRTAENSASTTGDFLPIVNATISSGGGVSVPRGYTGVGGIILMGKHGDPIKAGTSSALNASTSNVPFPNPIDGGLYLSPLWIHDQTTSPAGNIRGKMRGLWQVLHSISSFLDGDTITGTGTLAGRTFQIVKTSNSSSMYAMEISDTLDTN